MEVAGEEVDNEQAVRGTEAHDSVERAGAASNPIASREHAGERISDKGKVKVDEKMKEPMYIGGIPLVDLDDCNVTDNKLLCDSFDSNNDVSPNVDSVGVCNGLGSCSQTMDANVEITSRLVSLEVGEHSEPHITATASIDNPFFNATGETPHSDAMVIKQEASWFQLWKEKRQKKTAKKLVVKQEKERLAKEVEDARNQVVLLKQIFEQQYGTDIQALLARSVQVPRPHPPTSTPAPTVPRVPSPAFVFLHGVCGSQPLFLVPDDTMCGLSIPKNLNYP